MDIKVLGPGCTNCKTLEARVLEAVTELGIDSSIDKVTDYHAIASYGVMSTPALVIDDRVVLTGRVPALPELRDILTGAAS